jgi:hypothetical protein
VCVPASAFASTSVFNPACVPISRSFTDPASAASGSVYLTTNGLRKLWPDVGSLIVGTPVCVLIVTFSADTLAADSSATFW